MLSVLFAVCDTPARRWIRPSGRRPGNMYLVHLAAPPGAYADMPQDTLDDNCFDDQGRCRFLRFNSYTCVRACSIHANDDRQYPGPQFYPNVLFTLSSLQDAPLSAPVLTESTEMSASEMNTAAPCGRVSAYRFHRLWLVTGIGN